MAKTHRPSCAVIEMLSSSALATSVPYVTCAAIAMPTCVQAAIYFLVSSTLQPTKDSSLTHRRDPQHEPSRPPTPTGFRQAQAETHADGANARQVRDPEPFGTFP